MPILDFLIGRGNLDRMQDAGEDYARSAYDPSQADPMIQRGRQMATEGLDTDAMTQSIMSEVYRNNPRNMYGVSGAQGIAMQQEQDQARSQMMGEASTQIGLQDEQFRNQGKDMHAEGLANRKQLKAQRDAGIAESRMMVEAEAGARKQKLLSGTINLASAAIGGGEGGMLDFLSNFRNSGGGTAVNMAGSNEVINKAREGARGLI